MYISENAQFMVSSCCAHLFFLSFFLFLFLFFLKGNKVYFRTLIYNITLSLLPSVSTLIALEMFSGAKYTHYTFTPIIKHLITTANKHPGKKSFID